MCYYSYARAYVPINMFFPCSGLCSCEMDIDMQHYEDNIVHTYNFYNSYIHNLLSLLSLMFHCSYQCTENFSTATGPLTCHLPVSFIVRAFKSDGIFHFYCYQTC